ncbi:hypothetical protein LIN78_05420 [Leeia sp. TBRC 13508]|uniref:Histidine kinase domain-containing protein n=1 Tax=Leeia speluncae TaxID=2884804 RepID=A0ABS8D445_9NEIS|nr:hypothetical protein [Leeia speluncae]MCB6182986.1 hypothetical protein [Leeia speluncae]
MAQLIPTLLAAVVHDNKNLMHEVLLRIDAIAADERAEPIKSDIEQLRQKLKHLVDGSLSVLSLYQRNMDKESLQLNYNTVTLADFLQEILDESTDSVAQKGLEMEVLLDDELPSVWIFDADMVRLAIKVGIQNALDFAQHRIEVVCYSEDSRLCISIEDDGEYDSDSVPIHRPSASGVGIMLANQLLAAHEDQKTGRKGEVKFERSTRLSGAALRCYLP